MERTFHRIALATAAALGIASGIALANEPLHTAAERGRSGMDADARSRMARLDTDQDKQISKDEAKADPKLSRQFLNLDENRNNALDRGEFARFEADSAGDDRLDRY